MDHLDTSDFQHLRDGTASASEAQRFGAHLRECAACAERARIVFEADAQALAETFANDSVDDMLHPEDELASLVDGTLDAERRAAVERHLAVCTACHDEVEDLRSFGRAIRARRQRSRVAVWAAAAAATVVAITLLIAKDEGPMPTAPQHAALPNPEPPVLAPTTTTAGSPLSSRETAPRSRKRQWQTLVDDALRTGRLPLNDQVRRFSADDTYRGATVDQGGAVRPSGTAIAERQPTFEWPAADGARYEVTIVRSNGDVVENSGTLTKPRWQPSAPLSRGQVYRWQVRVQTEKETLILPAPPAPPALIRILDDAEAAELAEARRVHGDDHLLLALLNARAGVIAETRHQLEQYARAEKRIAQGFLAQLPHQVLQGSR
jgi:anti-sigma factor RsiW